MLNSIIYFNLVFLLVHIWRSMCLLGQFTLCVLKSDNKQYYIIYQIADFKGKNLSNYRDVKPTV